MRLRGRHGASTPKQSVPGCFHGDIHRGGCGIPSPCPLRRRWGDTQQGGCGIPSPCPLRRRWGDTQQGGCGIPPRFCRTRGRRRTEVPLRSLRTPGSVRPADRSPPSHAANTRFSPPSGPKSPFAVCEHPVQSAQPRPHPAQAALLPRHHRSDGRCGQPPGLSKDVWAGGGQPGRVVHGLSMQPAGWAPSRLKG